MALSRITTWSSGQVLTASALNAEIDNLLNNGASLVFPITAAADFNGQVLQNLSAGAVGSPGLYFNSDSDTGLYRSAANTVDVAVGGNRGLSVSTVTGATSYLSVGHGAVTTPQTVLLTASGTATNVNLSLVAAGTGYVIVPVGTTEGSDIIPGVGATGRVNTGLVSLAAGQLSLVALGRQVLQASAYAAATNYVVVSPNTAGGAPSVTVAGGDTNIGLLLDTKGGGTLTLGSADTASVSVATGFVPAAADAPTDSNTLYRENTPKAWVTFRGSNGAILDSFGVTSVSRVSAGIFTITWSTAFTASTYALAGLATGAAGGSGTVVSRHGAPSTTTTTATIICKDAGSVVDPADVDVIAFGKQT